MFQSPLQPLIFELITLVNNVFPDDLWKFLFSEKPKSRSFHITLGLYKRVDFQSSGYGSHELFPDEKI